MKVNQFSYHQVPLAQKLTELATLHFIATANTPNVSVVQLWAQLIDNALCEHHDAASKQAAKATLLADETTDLLSVCRHQKKLSAKNFYLVGLQLLGWLPFEDFDPTNWDKFWEQTNLPPMHRDFANNTDLLSAWYDLLLTHTKFGVSYLDLLASRGFFAKMYSLPAATKPLFFNGKALPVFDTTKVIREVVYVESDIDSDNDGKPDLLATQIIRPKETNPIKGDDAIKVPVIYTASPYNRGTNDTLGRQLTHNVNVSLSQKPTLTTTYAELERQSQQFATPTLAKSDTSNLTEAKFAHETFHNEYSYPLNDYMLARGFAVVYAAGIGTRDSDGLRTCGDDAETKSTIAIIKWLSGKANAYTSRDRRHLIKAWWCNHNVAMTGKSYLGTLAVAAATTGIEGLKTVIAEAAISSWYDYYREGGLVVAPGTFPGEDCDVLAAECTSRRHNAAEFARIKQKFAASLAQITHDQDRLTGNYSPFWHARNYRKSANQINCDVVLVHGLNDRNVKLRNVFRLWKRLPKGNHKLILHQGQHIYINNFASLDFLDMMNLWLSNKLYGIHNGATTILPRILVQDNTKPDCWHTKKHWVDPSAPTTTYYLSNHQTSGHFSLQQTRAQDTQIVSYSDHINHSAFINARKHYDKWRHDLIAGNEELLHSRCIFESQPFTSSRQIVGEPSVVLRASTDQKTGLLSCMLVDFGKEKRLNARPSIIDPLGMPLGFKQAAQHLMDFRLASDESDFKVISEGFINMQNQQNAWSTNQITPGQARTYTITLQPVNYHLPANHSLGLVIYGTDMELTVGDNHEQRYQLALADCSLTIRHTPAE